ncbi:MAG: class I SAM-dependent methyltransferase [Flavobacteriales bacterium]|nr:class I SAM-dependent methyltransferase [Flavobacteriales bacterium]
MNNIKDRVQFNSSADTYDDDFTFSNIGILQRKRVYYWLNQIDFFSTQKKIFEINCGTGYDAEQFHEKGHTVFATDVSDGMVTYAKEQRSDEINFETQSFQQVAQDSELSNYDTLFSNFGGLNCINPNQLFDFLKGVSSHQKKGNQLILVLMSKYCLMENIYFFLKFNFRQINRRNTNTGVEVNVKDEQVKTYYYLPEEIAQLLKPNYKIELIKPVACFLPPSYMEPFFKKHKKVLSFINRLEHFFGRFTFMAKWSDHYIIVAERK